MPTALPAAATPVARDELPGPVRRALPSGTVVCVDAGELGCSHGSCLSPGQLDVTASHRLPTPAAVRPLSWFHWTVSASLQSVHILRVSQRGLAKETHRLTTQRPKRKAGVGSHPAPEPSEEGAFASCQRLGCWLLGHHWFTAAFLPARSLSPGGFSLSSPFSPGPSAPCKAGPPRP